jgi:iron complex outermembrane receptor protein
MLVLIDGRAVYSPLFAGTYWEVQDLPLDDIERIEVVRGPGAALWGANAVTGIINIIRKTAATSQGTRVAVGTGNENPALVSVRHGGRAGTLGYRVSGKILARNPQRSLRGFDYDDQQLVQAGARADWETPRGLMTIQGDVYRTVIGNRDSLTTYAPPSREFIVTDDTLSGGNVLFRWSGRAGDPRAARLQAYYDRTRRRELVFREQQHTADIDYQQGRQWGRHGVLWGAAYRVVHGETDTGGTLRFFPPDRTDQLVSGFVQDDIVVVPDRVELLAGTRLEHNDYSGVEWQPRARLLWTPSAAHALSLAVTRAVRTPSRVEHDFESGNILDPDTPSFIRLQPNPGFRPEELVSYEAGYVASPHPRVLATLALFRNQHDDVMSTELRKMFVEMDAGGTRLIVPVQFDNGLHGHSYGVETTADVRVTPWWRSTVNYSYLRFHLSRQPGSADLTQEIAAEGGSPRHQVQVTTSIQIGSRGSVDWFYRYVAELPALPVPAYGTSNLRFEWAVHDGIGLFVIGRNLHDARHLEYEDGANGHFAIQRAVIAGVRWTR